jgi:hypothetical protein
MVARPLRKSSQAQLADQLPPARALVGRIDQRAQRRDAPAQLAEELGIALAARQDLRPSGSLCRRVI